MAAPNYIVIICSGLDTPGGIERAIVNTANLFYARGHKVRLLILADSGTSFYPIDPDISIRFAPLDFGITVEGNTVTKKLRFIHHISRLRAILKTLDPDLVITTEYQFTIAAALAWRSGRVISWEHHHFAHLVKSGFWRALYNLVYPRLQRVIALNPSEGAWYANRKCKVSVIANFGPPPSGPPGAERQKLLLTVGWLTTTKGIDLVAAIASNVFKHHPDWKWVFIGSGPEEEKLIRDLHSHGIEERVEILKPVTHDLSARYREASICVMPSKYECFPMVLLEAMSHGVPCVAFDCPTGPKHIIQDGEDGMLVPAGNVEAMGAAILQLIQNEEKRQSMGANAAQNIQRFTPGKTYALWKEVIGAE